MTTPEVSGVDDAGIVPLQRSDGGLSRHGGNGVDEAFVSVLFIVLADKGQYGEVKKALKKL